MEYVEVKEWLDKLVDNLKERSEIAELSNQIYSACADSYVIISKGIEIIADIMGLPLKAEYRSYREDEGMPYRYSFFYREIEFLNFQYEPIDGIEVVDVDGAG